MIVLKWFILLYTILLLAQLLLWLANIQITWIIRLNYLFLYLVEIFFWLLLLLFNFTPLDLFFYPSKWIWLLSGSAFIMPTLSLHIPIILLLLWFAFIQWHRIWVLITKIYIAFFEYTCLHQSPEMRYSFIFFFLIVVTDAILLKVERCWVVLLAICWLKGVLDGSC